MAVSPQIRMSAIGENIGSLLLTDLVLGFVLTAVYQGLSLGDSLVESLP